MVIADLPPPIQGIALVSKWVIQSLQNSGANVQVVNTSVRESFLYPINRVLKFSFALIRVLTARPKSTVYLALSHGPTLLAQTLIILACKARRNRVLVHHHTFLPINQPKMPQNYICHNLMRKSVEHVFLSEYMREKYLQIWNPQGETSVISNHQAAYARTRNHGEVKKILGKSLCYSGRLSSEKGFWDSASVTRDILQTYSEMTATFLGPAQNSHVSKEIESLCNDYPTRFHHIAEYDEITLSNALQSSTYFLFPSRYSNEASPLVVLEAQALGNICITSDIGSLRSDVITPGVSIDINEWQASVLKILKEFYLDKSNLQELSNQIRDISYKLSMQCGEQLKEVFRV